VTEPRSLLSIIHQVVTDEDFRNRLMHTPPETLIAELGISRETYQALMTAVPLLFTGGLFVLQGGIDGNVGPDAWGSWGRP
jgi:hypothetical protein